MRRKQVRFVGNCQSNALANFYREFVGTPAGEDVVSIDDLGLDIDAIRRAVEGADVVVVQERDFKHSLSEADLGGTMKVYTFPLIMAGFLWPFANEAHVRNVFERPISDGPYPSQMGDSFLNRLISKGVEPEDALGQYLALDIGRAASLDRMCEIYLDRQRQRDAATGFALADFIEANFRDRRLFLTAEHPDAELFGLTARQLFDKMGVPDDVTRGALDTLFRTPFPPTELPLHPGVIAHFQLQFADAETRYPYLDEGSFTFAEYVLRYMRYDNNPALRRAIYMAHRQPPAEALNEIDEALKLSPGSARGFEIKGVLLDRMDRHDEAIGAFRTALSIEPRSPEANVHLVRSLLHIGALAEAEATALRSVAIAPLFAPAHLALAETYVVLGDLNAARSSAAEALRLGPAKGAMYHRLALAMLAAGQIAEAESFARRGVDAEPLSPNQANLLAEVLEQQGRRAEAIALLTELRLKDAANDQTYSLLGNFWLRDGILDLAEEAFDHGAELHGRDRPDLYECLAQVRKLRQDAA